MKRSQKFHFDTKILLLFFACATPGLLAALFLLYIHEYGFREYLTLFVLVALPAFYAAIAAKEQMVHPLRTISNVLSSLRHKDFSMRIAGGDNSDVLRQVYYEINLFSQGLKDGRLGEMETKGFLERIMDSLDVVVLIFDADRKLSLANSLAHSFLGELGTLPLEKTADELGLAMCLDSTPGDFQLFSWKDGDRHWTVRRGQYRLEGKPYQLVLIADISSSLREQERESWQRLLRVLGHELNNSLAPIKSLATTLKKLLGKADSLEELHEDFEEGLEVIVERSNRIQRFMTDYSRLAKLPMPQRERVDLESLIERVMQLEGKGRFDLRKGKNCHVFVDSGQLEQALINLLKNAWEAMGDREDGVSLSWRVIVDHVEIIIEDEGTGIANPNNLFVPFYSTKQGGSGIGLVLSRQIVEAVDGHLSIVNRKDRIGCRATLLLPLY
jgi:nitrogen fixation/metabolism regulation signal transduction histidine kinase